MEKIIKRLDGIEILRGFAATAIVLFHLWALGGFKEHTGSLGSILSRFNIGVPLFYAISGFSLLYGYSNNFFNEFSIKKFYIRRFFRLAPLFYFMMFVYLILLKQQHSFSSILLNLTFTYGLIPAQNESIVWGGWSVGIEWLFYAVFPLFCLFSKSIKALMMAYIALFFVSLNMHELSGKVVDVTYKPDYIHILKHSIFFLTGAIAFKLIPVVQSFTSKNEWIKKYELIYLFCAVGIFPLLLGKIPIELLESVFQTMLLLWAVIGYSKIFNNTLTRLLGKLSYGLYLFNPLTIILLERARFYSFLMDVFDNQFASFAASGIITLAIIVLASYLAHIFIEQPGIQIGKNLVDIIKNNDTNKNKIALNSFQHSNFNKIN